MDKLFRLFCIIWLKHDISRARLSFYVSINFFLGGFVLDFSRTFFLKTCATIQNDGHTTSDKNRELSGWLKVIFPLAMEVFLQRQQQAKSSPQ